MTFSNIKLREGLMRRGICKDLVPTKCGYLKINILIRVEIPEYFSSL